jgi:glucosamine kinase
VPYYLGIDGGGTKTTCAVADESHVLATATTGPSNVVRVGEAKARESLQAAVRQACAAAGIAVEDVARTCVGASGAARPEIEEAVRGFLAEILASPVDVVGDIEISLEAAFDEGPGVIVIAGTGSIAYARNRLGRTLRAGGWGFAVGDEGSADWIGRTAINALLRASDRSPEIEHSPLAVALCNQWRANSLLDLAMIASSVPPPNFAELFRTVAASQDDIAIQVLTRAGRELAEIAEVVMTRLFEKDQTGSVLVAMIGGVFRHSALVREIFYNELRRLDARADVRPQVVDPVEGALRMARRSRKGRT